MLLRRKLSALRSLFIHICVFAFGILCGKLSNPVCHLSASSDAPERDPTPAHIPSIMFSLPKSESSCLIPDCVPQRSHSLSDSADDVSSYGGINESLGSAVAPLHPLQLMFAPIQAAVTTASIQLGIFEAVHRLGCATPGLVASSQGLHEPTVTDLFYTLRTMLFLRQKKHNCWELTPLAERFLLFKSPASVSGALVSFLNTRVRWGLFVMARTLKTGRWTPLPHPLPAEVYQELRFELYSITLAKQFAVHLVAVLKRLDVVQRMKSINGSGVPLVFTDAPCGSGMYGSEASVQYFAAVPHIVEFYDRAGNIGNVQQNHQKEYQSLPKRALWEYYGGDIPNSIRPSPYKTDIMFSSMSYHVWHNRDVGAEITRWYFQKLKPGGIFIGHDVFYPDTTRDSAQWSSADAAAFVYDAIQRPDPDHETTSPAWRVSEFSSILSSAGFTEIRVFHKTLVSTFIVARKPL
eukprot:PhF_6_TR12298/c0_g1_i1/m.19531